MNTIRFRFETTTYDDQVMGKRFHALSHIHNVMVKHAKKLLRKLEAHAGYQELKKQYAALSGKPELSPSEKRQKKHLSSAMKEIRDRLGLSEKGFQAYLVCGRQFSKCLSSQQVQKEASRVWAGTQRVLFSDGKDIHFKKYMDFETISGKTNTNGVKFDKMTFSISWLGLAIKCGPPKKETDAIYVAESLTIRYPTVRSRGRCSQTGGVTT